MNFDFIQKRLVPNRIDGWVWVFGLAALSMLLLPYFDLFLINHRLREVDFEWQRYYVLYISIAFFGGAALVLGWETESLRSSLRRHCWTVAACLIMGLILFAIWMYAASFLVDYSASFSFDLAKHKQNPWAVMTSKDFMQYAGLAAMAIVLLAIIAPRLVRWFLKVLTKPVQHRIEQVFKSRVQVLILVAACAFLINVGTQILSAEKYWDSFTSSWLKRRPIDDRPQLVFLTVGYFGFICLPSWLLMRIRSVWLGLTTIAVFSLILAMALMMNRSFWYGLIPVIIYLLVFLAIILIRCQSLKQRTGSAGIPSVWSFIPVLLVGSWISFIHLFDVAAGISSNGFDFVEARQARLAYIRSGRRIAKIYGNDIGFVRLRLTGQYSDEMVADFLDFNTGLLYLERIDSDFDTSFVANAGRQVVVDGGTVTSGQLSDLLGGAWYVYVANLEVVDPNQGVVLSRNTDLNININETTDLVGLLKSFDFSTPIRRLELVEEPESNRQFTNEELDVILEVSQKQPISLKPKLALKIPEASIGNRSARGLVILEEYRHWQESDDLLRKALGRLSGTDVTFQPGFRAGKMIDLLIAKQGQIELGSIGYRSARLFLDITKLESDSPNASSEFFKQSGLAYDVDDQGRIRGLYIPYNEMQVLPEAGFKLEELSYDVSWLIGKSSLKPPTPWTVNQLAPLESTTHLANHTHLKSLHFDLNQPVADLRFLESLPHLERLTIRLSEPLKFGTESIAACTKLKKLVHYGIPSDETIEQLRKLQNLEELVIHDELTGLIVEKQLSELRQQLPGVNIRVLNLDDDWDIPLEFIDYCQKVREKLWPRD